MLCSTMTAITASQKRAANNLEDFFNEQVPHPAEPKGNPQKRKYSYRPGGVAITEDRIILKIKRVMESKKKEGGIHPSFSPRSIKSCRSDHIILSS